MSNIRSVAPLLRRSVVASRSKQSSLRGGATPPTPPFARLPTPTQKLTEHHDSVWDDGVAPEVALDFDCQHIDSTTGFFMWLGGLGFFTTVFHVIKATDPGAKNPAVNRTMNMVVDSPKRGPPVLQ